MPYFQGVKGGGGERVFLHEQQRFRMEKQFECLRCTAQMKYLKEYRFDSQDEKEERITEKFLKNRCP